MSFGACRPGNAKDSKETNDPNQLTKSCAVARVKRSANSVLFEDGAIRPFDPDEQLSYDNKGRDFADFDAIHQKAANMDMPEYFGSDFNTVYAGIALLRLKFGRSRPNKFENSRISNHILAPHT